MATKTLAKLLTKCAIVDITGDVYFARGANYFTDGAVETREQNPAYAPPA